MRHLPVGVVGVVVMVGVVVVGVTVVVGVVVVGVVTVGVVVGVVTVVMVNVAGETSSRVRTCWCVTPPPVADTIRL